MKIRLSTYVMLSLLLLGGLSTCRKTPGSEAPLVYQADPVLITVRELESSFLLHPHFSPQLKGRQALQAHLDGLVRYKYLALQAGQQKLDRDDRLQARLQWQKKKAMREQLFLNAIADRIQISETEMRQAFRLRQKYIKARHLFLPTLEQALAWRQRLQQGTDFEQAAREVYAGVDDDMAAQGGQLPEFTWGYMDPAFESAAFQVQPGELSYPVASRWGYHLIRVDSVTVQPFVTEVDFNQDRKNIERVLRARREDSLATLYVADVMKGINVRVKAAAFTYIVNQARQARNEQAGFPRPSSISDQEWSAIAASLQERGQEPFVVFADAQWTIADFIKRFQAIPPLYRPHVYNPSRFEKELRDMIRDEFLDRQAEKQNLAKHPYVQEKYQQAREQLLYAAMVQHLSESITVSAAEEEQYARSHGLDCQSEEQRQIIRRRLHAVKRDSVITAAVSPWLKATTATVDPSLFDNVLENLGGAKAAFITVWQPPQR